MIGASAGEGMWFARTEERRGNLRDQQSRFQCVAPPAGGLAGAIADGKRNAAAYGLAKSIDDAGRFGVAEITLPVIPSLSRDH